MIHFALYRIGSTIEYRGTDGKLRSSAVIKIMYELKPNHGETVYLLEDGALVDETGTLARERLARLEAIGSRISQMGKE